MTYGSELHRAGFRRWSWRVEADADSALVWSGEARSRRSAALEAARLCRQLRALDAYVAHSAPGGRDIHPVRPVSRPAAPWRGEATIAHQAQTA